jgi:hypothetical protein
MMTAATASNTPLREEAAVPVGCALRAMRYWPVVAGRMTLPRTIDSTMINEITRNNVMRQSRFGAFLRAIRTSLTT